MKTQRWTLMQLAGRKVFSIARPVIDGRQSAQTLDPNPKQSTGRQ